VIRAKWVKPARRSTEWLDRGDQGGFRSIGNSQRRRFAPATMQEAVFRNDSTTVAIFSNSKHNETPPLGRHVWSPTA
jgi:hypothetical protein